MKRHNYSEVENMMLNIHGEGEEAMLEYVESAKNPYIRIKRRNIYYFALDKMRGK